mgnify:CR=1 FL=1
MTLYLGTSLMIKNRFTEGKIKDFTSNLFLNHYSLNLIQDFGWLKKKTHSTALLTLDQSMFDSSSHSSVNVALLHAPFCQRFQFFAPF